VWLSPKRLGPRLAVASHEATGPHIQKIVCMPVVTPTNGILRVHKRSPFVGVVDSGRGAGDAIARSNSVSTPVKRALGAPASSVTFAIHVGSHRIAFRY